MSADISRQPDCRHEDDKMSGASQLKRLANGDVLVGQALI